MSASRRNIEFAADKRIDACFMAGLLKAQRTEHIAMVSQSKGGHAQFFGAVNQCCYFRSAVKQRIIGMDVEMDKIIHVFQSTTNGRFFEAD